MASHHTKDKGDLGLAMVVADMCAAGISVYLPMSEHQPADLVAMNEEGRMVAVQVKYKKLSATGVIELELRSTYSDSKGSHAKLTDRTRFDCYAVYCPDNGKVYYIRNEEIMNSMQLKLRVLPTRNSQRKRVVDASQYIGVDRIFETLRPRGATDSASDF